MGCRPRLGGRGLLQTQALNFRVQALPGSLTPRIIKIVQGTGPFSYQDPGDPAEDHGYADTQPRRYKSPFFSDLFPHDREGGKAGDEEIDENGELVREVGYKVCHNYAPVKSVTIMEVLGVMIDLRGYSMLVPPQIKNILKGFEDELSSKDIEVCVFLDREDDDEINYFLFSNGQLIKKFQLEEVLKLEIT